jgi:hypothetical protein
LPAIGRNFIGINNGGQNEPLDNTIAISNAGLIVTCVNAMVVYTDVNGTYIYGQTLHNFINDTSLSTNLCDPKVIYDSGTDHFIFFAQTYDGLAATSKIVVGFSLTNNPSNGWYFYKLSGNPLNNNCWFDYPKIAVSTNELYVTGNLFGDNKGPFNQAILFQIQKTNCFTGGAMTSQVWSNIAGAPSTLLPASYGQQGTYGPGIFLVSTASATTGSTNINLYDLTNDMSSGTAQLNYYSVATTNYSTAAHAQQLGGTKLLNSSDSRTLDGFYLNGVIHFVFHSDIGSGWNGINYNRLTVSTTTNISSTFGVAGSFHYCFPCVASIASTVTDKSVIISFSRSGPSIYPEIRVINCDDNMIWSNSTLVKGGDSYVSYSWNPATTERWGDYSGISRKQNENPPRVWVSGDYGNAQNYWRQWIAEIYNNSATAIQENHASLANAKIYPNPIVSTYRVEFELTQEEIIQIQIFNVNGQLIKELFNGRSQKGANEFTFNKANLNAGVYFLNIKSGTKIIKNEKIIVSE